jgi:uncharacterized protein DUF2252
MIGRDLVGDLAMDIAEATRAYDGWARRQIRFVARDLKLKHRLMAEAAFPFLRATFYRWMQVWPQACPDLARAPRLLAVGDLHVENFGTWRDIEGRLVWGINDFDEVYPLPYTIDLVRLATSVLLAIREDSLSIDANRACAAILRGYTQSLAAGGHAYVLEEHHPALRALAYAEERDPQRFWAKVAHGKPASPPSRLAKRLKRDLPRGSAQVRFVSRVAGLGSLGHPRYVALADCHGSWLAREAKAVLPSAAAWATHARRATILSGVLMSRALRSPDPFVRVEHSWLMRRIGPHCSRIELADFPKRSDEVRILEAMGGETANVHLGNPTRSRPCGTTSRRAARNGSALPPRPWRRPCSRIGRTGAGPSEICNFR